MKCIQACCQSSSVDNDLLAGASRSEAHHRPTAMAVECCSHIVHWHWMFTRLRAHPALGDPESAEANDSVESLKDDVR